MSNSVTIQAGPQPIEVFTHDEHIHVAVVKETIQPAVDVAGVQCQLQEERLEFSSPLALAAPGWPFGPNPNKVSGLQHGVNMVVDSVVMPTYYRVARWLLLIEDESNGLAVSSELKCIRCGNTVHYIEYAIIGDSGLIPYQLDVEADGGRVNVLLKSDYEGGELTVRTVKIGIFN